jgi:hypothetical protein
MPTLPALTHVILCAHVQTCRRCKSRFSDLPFDACVCVQQARLARTGSLDQLTHAARLTGLGTPFESSRNGWSRPSPVKTLPPSSLEQQHRPPRPTHQLQQQRQPLNAPQSHSALRTLRSPPPSSPAADLIPADSAFAPQPMRSVVKDNSVPLDDGARSPGSASSSSVLASLASGADKAGLMSGRAASDAAAGAQDAAVAFGSGIAPGLHGSTSAGGGTTDRSGSVHAATAKAPCVTSAAATSPLQETPGDAQRGHSPLSPLLPGPPQPSQTLSMHSAAVSTALAAATQSSNSQPPSAANNTLAASVGPGALVQAVPSAAAPAGTAQLQRRGASNAFWGHQRVPLHAVFGRPARDTIFTSIPRPTGSMRSTMSMSQPSTSQRV